MLLVVLSLTVAIVVFVNWVHIVAWVTKKRIAFYHWLAGIKFALFEFLDDLGLL